MSVEGCRHGPREIIPQPCAQCVADKAAEAERIAPLLAKVEALSAQIEAAERGQPVPAGEPKPFDNRPRRMACGCSYWPADQQVRLPCTAHGKALYAQLRTTPERTPRPDGTPKGELCKKCGRYEYYCTCQRTPVVADEGEVQELIGELQTVASTLRECFPGFAGAAHLCERAASALSRLQEGCVPKQAKRVVPKEEA